MRERRQGELPDIPVDAFVAALSLSMWLYNTGSCPLSSAWNVSLVRLPLGHVVVCAAGGLLWRRQGAILSTVLAAKLTRPP